MTTAPTKPATIKRLSQRWADAYDCWVNAPGRSGEPLFACPQSHPEDLGTSEWPAPVRQLPFDIFGLSAGNPLGQEWPAERNCEAHDRLQDDLNEQLQPTTGECWWHAYGFGRTWREDGFVVSCPRSKVMALARKYQQGAIYQFVFDKIDPETAVVVRRTVPVLLPGVEADVRMITTTWEGWPDTAANDSNDDV